MQVTKFITERQQKEAAKKEHEASTQQAGAEQDTNGRP